MSIRLSRNDTLDSLRAPQINCSTRVFLDVTLCHAFSVIFNEPLTFLQRVAEYMEYVYLLHTAASLDDQLQRMQVKITCHAFVKLFGNF